MPEQPAETRFTLLNPARDVEHAELGRLYAYPPVTGRSWVRANFISSIDGAATVAGRSGGLAGPGDRTVFTVLRSLADVIVVGAGTVRAENYGGAHLGGGERQHRAERGQSEIPQVAIVTRSGRLDRDLRVFTETELPPLVLTCTASAPAARERLAGLAEVLDCSAGDPGAVDQATLLAVLAQRNQHRVLTEGGPSLFASFVEAGLLDELCLTVAPYLVAGDARRITTGTRQALTAMHCAHLLTDESGYLYTRYVRDV